MTQFNQTRPRGGFLLWQHTLQHWKCRCRVCKMDKTFDARADSGGDMFSKLMLLLVVGVLSSSGHAQTFKCKTPSGATVISDTPCTNGARAEKVQSSEYISPERQRQAIEVNQRNARQLQGIEAANEAYQQQLQRQQAVQIQNDARAAANENARRQQDDCARLAADKNMGRSQRAALAELCASQQPNRERFDDCKEQIAKAGNPSQRAMIASNCTGDPGSAARVRDASRPTVVQPIEHPSPITSCDRSGCWDGAGNRYNGNGSTFFRTDGKTCQKMGSMMQCN